MEAQFDCRSLNLERKHWKNPSSSTLNEVREIVRAVYDQKKTEPAFHLRALPPVRFPPKGLPLLLLLVIDHWLAQQLINKGILDREKYQSDVNEIIIQSDLHHINVLGISREIYLIRSSSTEELDLFRFSLRLNSTKMRRGAWQSKKVPRGDDSPWMTTYVTPLYAENITRDCGKVDRVFLEISGGRCCCGLLRHLFSEENRLKVLSPFWAFHLFFIVSRVMLLFPSIPMHFWFKIVVF